MLNNSDCLAQNPVDTISQKTPSGSMTSIKSLSIPPKLQVDVIVMKKLIEDLERGKEAALMMRSIILEQCQGVKIEDIYRNDNNINQDYYKALDHHSIVALDTYATSLSMLKCCDDKGDFIEKRKLHQANHHHIDSFDDHGTRDCYKKRKFEETKEEKITHLTKDGFIWRKYGQKKIHKHHHPRHYYRCTNKEEQKCQATKQVQQISHNPTKYKIIYYGNHTCNNINLKTAPFMMDSPKEHSSAFVLSFDQSSQVNPLLFPSRAYPAATATSSINHNSSPSSDVLSISDDGLSISDYETTMLSLNGASLNPVSERSEGISKDEIYSSTLDFDNLEKDYNCMMADFSELSHELWTW